MLAIAEFLRVPLVTYDNPGHFSSPCLQAPLAGWSPSGLAGMAYNWLWAESAIASLGSS